MTWTAPADGDFIVAVGDVSHHGGNEFLYRLTVAEAKPSIAATVSSHSVSASPGKPVELKVNVKRANGFKAGLQLVAKNLPDGVSATEVNVPDKDGEVTLKMNVAENAAPAGAPFQLMLRDAGGGSEYPVVYRLITTGENNGVPQGYTELVIDSTDQLWLTIVKTK